MTKSEKIIGICLAALSATSGCGHTAPGDEATAKVDAGVSEIKISVQLPPIVSEVKVDVKKDCGAQGDGKTNDTVAFQNAAKLIQEKGGGTLVIPAGTYIVGAQKHEDGKYPYYQVQPIFHVRNLNGLLIEGNNAKLKFASGLRFGSFDKDTGAVYNPKLPFTDTDYAVHAGVMLHIFGSRNVIVRNLELDGNSPNLLLGGFWNYDGRQLWAYGLHMNNNSGVHIQNVHTHHHGTDGISIGWEGLGENDPPTPHTLVDVVSEYNARQGLSWIGGRSLKVYRSKFNHTGRAINNGEPVISAPGAGLDIEAESSVTRDGYFEDCEFVNNVGPGMAAESGDSGYTTFKNCTFWGTTTWSLWTRKPAIKFEDCKIYGSAVHAYASPDPLLATRWTRCIFEDKPWKDGKVYYRDSTSYLLQLDGDMQNVMLKDCTFIANTCRSVWATASADGRISFDGCTIIHKKSDLPDKGFQAMFRFVNFSGCRFQETFAREVKRQWFIASENAAIAAQPPTIVEGPRVKWLNWSLGKAGVLPATSAP